MLVPNAPLHALAGYLDFDCVRYWRACHRRRRVNDPDGSKFTHSKQLSYRCRTGDVRWQRSIVHPTNACSVLCHWASLATRCHAWPRQQRAVDDSGLVELYRPAHANNAERGTGAHQDFGAGARGPNGAIIVTTCTDGRL
jgi:hypothetical protein